MSSPIWNNAVLNILAMIIWLSVDDDFGRCIKCREGKFTSRASVYASEKAILPLSWCVLVHPVAWSCVTLWDPVDHSSPGSSVHGISQGTLLEYSLEKTLMLGKIECRQIRGWHRIKELDGTIDSMDMSLSKFQEMVKDREAWSVAVQGVSKSWTRLSNWTAATEYWSGLPLPPLGVFPTLSW